MRPCVPNIVNPSGSASAKLPRVRFSVALTIKYPWPSLNPVEIPRKRITQPDTL
jgi:hypothetical protein